MSQGFAKRFRPALLDVFSKAYSRPALIRDLSAGLTVAVIALPFAMAVGIGSIPDRVAMAEKLVPPAIGITSAVLGGLILSLIGGSRVQIGGPSGVSIAILYSIAASHGFSGLALATAMAGVILILMGVSGLGQMVKFIPYPVTTGFTAGSGVIIATTQIKDFFGLRIQNIAPDFIGKVQAYAANAGTASWKTLAVGGVSLATIIVVRRWAPKIPAFLAAVFVGVLATWALQVVWPQGGIVETIGTRFGGLPRTFEWTHFPPVTMQLVRELIPAATTIAVLCSIEALLSDLVADGMTGFRHRSDLQLVSLGVGNLLCAVTGGLPLTGGTARTVANIKAGGTTPIAGISHAIIIAGTVYFAAPLAKSVPLASLAAVLFVVAYNMTDVQQFRKLLKTPPSDVVVLLTTFGLTVFFGLPLAVGTGMVLASLLFMKKMSELSGVQDLTAGTEDDANFKGYELKDPAVVTRESVPPGVQVFEINGPFFFAVADKLKDILAQSQQPPQIFILRMRRVVHIDASGLHAIEEFHDRCAAMNTRLYLGGVHAQPLFEMVRAGLDQKIGLENIFENLGDALERARIEVGEERP